MSIILATTSVLLSLYPHPLGRARFESSSSSAGASVGAGADGGEGGGRGGGASHYRNAEDCGNSGEGNASWRDKKN